LILIVKPAPASREHPGTGNPTFDSIGHKRLRSAQHPSPSSGAWDAASFCFI
jgi:hypothetical protein